MVNGIQSDSIQKARFMTELMKVKSSNIGPIKCARFGNALIVAAVAAIQALYWGCWEGFGALVGLTLSGTTTTIEK
jgi:hypothetical protein